MSLLRKEMKDIEERYKLSWQGWFYAIQRIDLLIVSISGAGIYAMLESLKYSFEKEISNVTWLKVSGVMFIIAIVINFISQLTGKKANEHDMCMCREKLNATPDQNKISRHDCLADIYTNWTNGLNVSSLIAMILGLAFIMTHFLVIF